jgi:hypothetical protein
MAKRRRRIPATSPEEGKRIVDFIDDAILDFEGSADELEQAIGFYFIGRHIGWRPLVLMHDKRTIRKWEKALKIDIRQEFAEVGADADRSRGFRYAQKLSNFWKAVSGEEKVPERRII